MTDQPRTVLWLDQTHEDPARPGYFIPNAVTEDEPGYSPLTGNGRHAQPYYFGPGIEAAKAQCAEYNARLGIDEETALLIVFSSMRAGNVQQ